MRDPPFAELAAASGRVGGTRSRLEKERILVELLKTLPPERIAAAVGWLVAEPVCGPLGVGPMHLWELSKTPPAPAPSVTLGELELALETARGLAREDALERVTAVFERLDDSERAFFVGALTGSLRQGSLGGVMTRAIAQLASRDEAEVRRAVMVRGSIVRAAEALLGPHPEATAPAALELFHPVAPMLAAHASSIEEALEALAGIEVEVEWKVDGVRAQIHKDGERVAVYSRQGNDITAGCAPLLAALASLPVATAVLDGEVALVGPDAVVRPFQDSFSAIASKGMVPQGDRLHAYLFDCLHRDGTDLLDQPLAVRLEALAAIAPDAIRVPSVRLSSAVDATRVYEDALAHGHEGVVVKDLSSPYRLGARGRAWQKVKEFATVDLVVLAAEWGSGRRTGSLSNLHLGARRADGTFCMVGKTFKGLTDALLAWQTARLQELETAREGHVVHVRPELVVEIRYNDVQRSPRYPGGIALRFARVVRYREDKPASEADLLESLVARLPAADREAIARPKRGERAAARAEAKKRQLSLFDD